MLNICGLKYDFSRILNWFIRPLNLTQNDMCITSDKNANFNILKHLLCKVKTSNSLGSNVVQFTIFKRHQPMICLPCTCRGRTAMWFPADSSHMSCVELAFKGVLCTCLSSRGGSLRHGFFPFMLMDPNKRQTAVCGCYFLHGMAVHMRGLVYVCPCLHCFQGNFLLCICHKLL